MNIEKLLIYLKTLIKRLLFTKFYTLKPFNIFINRIHNQNPLTKENLLKMKEDLESVTSKILPNEKINTIAYGCTSGTIAIGEDKVKELILLGKKNCYERTLFFLYLFYFKRLSLIECWILSSSKHN